MTADIGRPLTDEAPELFEAMDGPRVRGGRMSDEEEDDRLEDETSF